jgi:hypothetical protein
MLALGTVAGDLLIAVLALAAVALFVWIIKAIR